MAAIALMLIVAVPLLLGFALNYEETEKTAWQSTQTMNLTETLLNSSTPYYTSYNGPNNNSAILVKEANDELQQAGIKAPAYNSVSTNPSTIPYKDYPSSINRTLTETRTSFNFNNGNYYWGTVPDTTNATAFADHDIYKFSALNCTFILYPVNGEPETINLGMSDSLNIRILRITDTTYTFMTFDGNAPATIKENLAGIRLNSPNYAFNGGATADAVDLNIIGSTASKRFSLLDYEYVKFTHTDGSIETFIRTSLDDVITLVLDVTSAAILANDTLTTYNDLSKIEYYSNYYDVANDGNITFSTIRVWPSGLAPGPRWADPAAGWKTFKPTYDPEEEGATITSWWMNGYTNNSIRLMVEIPAGSQTELTPTGGMPAVIRNTGGTVYVNNTMLGNYTYLMVTISNGSTQVSGISNWPSMGTMPVLYNTLTINNSDADFSAIEISDDLNVSYRVDMAEIISGYYPVTKDYTFNPNQKFPNTSYNIRFNSVAVYGDSITLAGTQYTVTDGRITVNDQIVPLLHSEIRSIYNDQTLEYDNTINGIALSSTAAPAAISFGGEWSVIAYFYGMEKLTEPAMEWRAGGFGFSEQGTLIVALLVDAAVFVGLGFYGRRSGVKVGWLLALCGCAGFVILCMM